MKVTFISDLHGENLWKKAIEKDSDLFIFLGDYFDSFTVTHREQLKNFEELIYFGENNKNKTVFLLGNHDIHYLLWHTPFYDQMRGSGFSSSLVWKVNNIYNDHRDLFQVAWQKNNVLVTHAGLRQDYYNEELKRVHERYSDHNYADLLNFLWKERSGLLMRIGRDRGGGDKWGGVFWGDMFELTQNPLQGMIQVVGHTPLRDIEDIRIDENTRLVFVDCLIYRKDKKENPLFFEMELIN